MTNEELRERIMELVPDEADSSRIIILKGDEFADGAVGLTEDKHLVYSYSKLVTSLANSYKDDYETIEDAEIAAMEFLEYNTIPSIPNMKSDGNEPIIMYDL